MCVNFKVTLSLSAKLYRMYKVCLPFKHAKIYLLSFEELLFITAL